MFDDFVFIDTVAAVAGTVAIAVADAGDARICGVVIDAPWPSEVALTLGRRMIKEIGGGLGFGFGLGGACIFANVAVRTLEVLVKWSLPFFRRMMESA